MNVGRRIRKLRIRRGLVIEDLARKSGLSTASTGTEACRTGSRTAAPRRPASGRRRTLSWVELRRLIVGVLFIAIVLLFPGGLIEAVARSLALLRRRSPVLHGDAPDRVGPA